MTNLIKGAQRLLPLLPALRHQKQAIGEHFGVRLDLDHLLLQWCEA